MEMEAVADIFDNDGDGFIDYKEFVAALRPERAEVSKNKNKNKKHPLNPYQTYYIISDPLHKTWFPDWFDICVIFMLFYVVYRKWGQWQKANAFMMK